MRGGLKRSSVFEGCRPSTRCSKPRAARAFRLSPEGFHAVARDFNPGRAMHVRPRLLVFAADRRENEMLGERGNRHFITGLRRFPFGGGAPQVSSTAVATCHPGWADVLVENCLR